MALKIKTPTTKIFPLREIAGEEGIEVTDVDNQQGFVTFRQGTNGDNQQRFQVMSERKWRFNQGDSVVDQISNYNPLAMAETEVRLTLVDTDITFADGKSLQFISTDGPRRVADAKEFETWWRNLPPGWGAVIYECCLEVNPNWGLKSGG